MPDFDKMAAEVVKAAQEFVSRAVAGLVKSIDELTEMAAALDRRVSTLPTPKDGTSAYQLACLGGFAGSEKEWLDSLRGKDAAIDKDEIRKWIVGELGVEIGKLPKPEKGDRGDSVHPDTVQLMINKEVEKTLSAWPRPKDGNDGLGFEDLAVEYDGRRSFAIKFQRGEQVKEFAFKLPVILDAGVYRRGHGYEKGDSTTWDGSMWIAQRDTEDRPGESDAWRLSVKHGRPGKDFDTPGPSEKQVVRLR